MLAINHGRVAERWGMSIELRFGEGNMVPSARDMPFSTIGQYVF